MSDIGWNSLKSIEDEFQNSKKKYRSYRDIEPGYHHAEIISAVVDMSNKGIKIEWLLDVNGTALKKWSFITNKQSSVDVFLKEMAVIGLEIDSLLKLQDSDFDSAIGTKVLIEVKDKIEEDGRQFKPVVFERML